MRSCPPAAPAAGGVADAAAGDFWSSCAPSWSSALGAYTAVKVIGPVYRSVTAGDDYKGSGSGSVTIEIEAGQSGRSIGETLQQDGVVKTAGAFASAASADPAAAGIQPGTYTLRAKMSAASALAMLAEPDLADHRPDRRA